ncbi:MCE family protein [Gordonia sp. ABSL1-1]|uniref:MCE family protein n=1 Tax=Gordonia sp. ABSL1-1 TaxID=3053923 RepID=UPI00257427B5|nr:MCE family protein [Gordonia sp. ABSL1-1]MDL9936500.1 MCE family protein [Gordonia sp. ABSL1-1]
MSLVVAGCGYDGPGSVPVPGAEGTGDGAYQITAIIPTAAGLVNNAPVYIDDSTVGSVGDIEVKDWNAQVTIRLKKGTMVPQGSHVMVGMTSVLGSMHLQIVQPAEPTGQMMKAGEEIPLTQCPEQPQIKAPTDTPLVADINVAQDVALCTYPTTEQVLSSLSVVLNGGGLSQMGDIVHEMNDIFSGHQTSIRNLIPQLNTLVGELNDQKADIIRATEGLDRLSRSMNEQSATIENALQASPRILQLLVDQRKPLTDALAAAAKLSTTANDVLDANTDDIKAFAHNLRPALEQLAATGPALSQSLNILLTFPFYEPSIRKLVKGDYVNSDLVLDLTFARLNKSMFASIGLTGPEGVLGRRAGAAARGLDPFLSPLKPGGERPRDTADPVPAPGMLPAGATPRHHTPDPTTPRGGGR